MHGEQFLTHDQNSFNRRRRTEYAPTCPRWSQAAAAAARGGWSEDRRAAVDAAGARGEGDEAGARAPFAVAAPASRSAQLPNAVLRLLGGVIAPLLRAAA